MKYAQTPDASGNVRANTIKWITRLIAVSAVLLIVGIFIFTGFYAVPADSVAAVQHFGRYARSEDPGLHFKMPFSVNTTVSFPRPGARRPA
jgi:regulator of protease activity HflC (stomatin/prohibitin superfamily)